MFKSSMLGQLRPNMQMFQAVVYCHFILSSLIERMSSHPSFQNLSRYFFSLSLEAPSPSVNVLIKLNNTAASSSRQIQPHKTLERTNIGNFYKPNSRGKNQSRSCRRMTSRRRIADLRPLKWRLFCLLEPIFFRLLLNSLLYLICALLLLWFGRLSCFAFGPSLA